MTTVVVIFIFIQVHIVCFVPHLHTQVGYYIGFTEMWLSLLQTEGGATAGDKVTRSCVLGICNCPLCFLITTACFDRKCFFESITIVFEKLFCVHEIPCF